jgi:hypothetical protein
VRSLFTGLVLVQKPNKKAAAEFSGAAWLGQGRLVRSQIAPGASAREGIDVPASRRPFPAGEQLIRYMHHVAHGGA